MQDISSNILRYVIDLHFKVLTKNDMISFTEWQVNVREGFDKLYVNLCV